MYKNKNNEHFTVVQKWWIYRIYKQDNDNFSNIHRDMVMHIIKDPFGSNPKDSKVRHVGDF